MHHRRVLAVCVAAAVLAIAAWWIARAESTHEIAAPSSHSSGPPELVREASASRADVPAPPRVQPVESSRAGPARGRRALALSGAAVDADGIRLRNSEFEWNLATLDQVVGRGDVLAAAVVRDHATTDAEGAFRILVELPEIGASQRRVLALEHTAGGYASEIRGRASVPPDGDERDVGIVRLEPRHVVFAGVVVDESGRSLAEIRVSSRYSADPRLDVRPWRGDPSRTVTGRDGRFELRAWDDDAAFDVFAGADEWKTAKLEALQPRKLDLSIVLRPSTAASLRVSVLDGSGDCGALRAVLSQCGAQNHDLDVELPVDVREQQTYYLRPIAPGDYDLVLRDSWVGAELARVEQIHVLPHRAVDDPRVQPLDLTAKVRCVRVRTVDSDGAPAKFFKLALAVRTDQGGELISNGDGWASFRLPREAPDLEAVDAYGRTQTLFDGASIVVIVR